MSNVGAGRDLPRGDFGAFEGELVQAGTVTFQGQRPAPRLVHEGDTVYLLVEAEVRSVGFSRNTDGDLVRRHVLRVVEAAEAPDRIHDAVITVVRAAADEREGREALPGINDPDPDLADLSEDELLALEQKLAAEEAAADEADGTDPEAEG